MPDMTTLSRDAILAANDIKAETLSVPEWGGDVRIAVMSGLARDLFVEMQNDGQTAYSLFQARLIAATVVDDRGDLLFTAQDVEKLRGKSRAVLDRLTQEAVRINGMSVEAIERNEKNSGADPSGDSGSSSPSPSGKQ